MQRLTGAVFAAFLALGISGICLAEGESDSSIQFAPPPFAMTNLTANDAVQTFSFDYMNLKMGDTFNLNALNIGFGRMAKEWETGGMSIGFSEQIILGSMNMGDTDASLFGIGIGMPFNVIFDPMSHSGDDNSLPMYAGFHMSTMMMGGSFETDYMYLDHFEYVGISPWGVWVPVYETTKITATLSVSTVNLGWHMGIQYGLNLGDAVKIIPYIDFSQEVVAMSAFSVSTAYDSMSNSSSNGPLPLTMMPGFDIVLRQLGLSLGGASQTMKQEGGDMKQFNLHLRFTQKFRSICGL